MTSDSSKPTDSADPAAATLLSGITCPEDVQALEGDQLVPLAEEIRETLIRTLARTGGHLGPNLGVVELTIALHRVFTTPHDKFVMDVSHQGYVHKMLTGRASEIESIRQYQGLNGFLLRTESEHDCYGAGHAGTALSAALGMAAARDLKGTDEHVVAVAGDAAFTCGPTLEALNNIAHTTKRFIVVLNDNEWSIDKNVGAIAKYFNALQTNTAYSGVRDKAADFVEWVGGKGVRRLAHKIERSAKNLLFPNVLFEKFGLRYFGPIDGHNLPLLVKTFEYLKKQDEPVVLHIITEKGRGYKPALDKPGKFHGLGPYNVEGRFHQFGRSAHLFGSLRPRRHRLRQGGRKNRGRDRRHAGRNQARHLQGGNPRTLLRCRDRGRTCRPLRLRPRHRGSQALPQHLFHVHAAGLRHDHS